MDFYNTIPSGPSSRPYNPNENGPSSNSMSPTFPSYPLMTDLPFDSHQTGNQPQQHSHSHSRPIPQHTHSTQTQTTSAHDLQPLEGEGEVQDDGNTLHEDHSLDHDQEQEQEQEREQEQEHGSSVIEYDDSLPLVEPHQSLDSFLESFWTRQMGVVERDNPDFRTYPLPLARIKKVMKSDEEVKVGPSSHVFPFPTSCLILILILILVLVLVLSSLGIFGNIVCVVVPMGEGRGEE